MLITSISNLPSPMRSSLRINGTGSTLPAHAQNCVGSWTKFFQMCIIQTLLVLPKTGSRGPAHLLYQPKTNILLHTGGIHGVRLPAQTDKSRQSTSLETNAVVHVAAVTFCIGMCRPDDSSGSMASTASS